MGTGLAIELVLTGTVLSVVETISPGLAVPEASTTSLVLPGDGGLNGPGPDEAPALSHGLGGGPLAAETGNECHELQQTNKKDGWSGSILQSGPTLHQLPQD